MSFVNVNPKISIIIISIAVSFFISLVNYFVLDKDKVKELRERQKNLNEEIKKHKDNPQKLQELNKEMFGHMGETMKHQMKPSLITMIPLLIAFPFIRKMFLATAIGGSWFWYYLISAIAASLVFRKLFKLP